MFKINLNTLRRIEALRLIGSGSGCLDAEIRLANSQNKPIDLDTLRQARALEALNPGARLAIVRLLDREIRRQEKAQARAA